ncbi:MULTISPECIES: L-threonylcarbamoyladenylate synthase [Micrococcaceae]|uniref:L-threonylcarbamoyladenylate synthase n=1 Tax=Micrococcaceae TaxID=1268 RepID=UPI0006FD687C|nr:MULTISPECIES: L-threonylcarbamoyladenylate synthase [Micrococcaceae]KQQ80382.1 threonylcarbamoyl-AMP synthase [Arthrobacter sp. Leaf137]MCT9624992.1 threonylcarbamoyl-AMP synthase [Pseudarthrobacter equi]
MTTTYDCSTDDQRAEALEHAQRAISEKKCVVLPTDTVYGIAADAFSPQAVTMLLVSKGRSRTMPPPVLIPRINALDGLATDISADARKLAEAFWPGGLTLIFHAQPSLDWDLGETKGTVALRMPADEIAQELLTLTGPLAVSSANRTGHAPAQTAAAAREQLADSVEVYLEGGFRPAEGADAVPSTIVDATGPRLRVVRNGAVSLDQLREHVPGVLGLGEIPMAEEDAGNDAAKGESAGVESFGAEPVAAESATADAAAKPEPADAATPAREQQP